VPFPSGFNDLFDDLDIKDHLAISSSDKYHLIHQQVSQILQFSELIIFKGMTGKIIGGYTLSYERIDT
jgi:hypothetical protein